MSSLYWINFWLVISPLQYFSYIKSAKDYCSAKTSNKTLNKRNSKHYHPLPPPSKAQTNKFHHTNCQNKPWRYLFTWIPLDPSGYIFSPSEKTNRSKRLSLREGRGQISDVRNSICRQDFNYSPFMLYRKRTSQNWSKMLKLQNAHFCPVLRMRSALHCNFHQLLL